MPACVYSGGCRISFAERSEAHDKILYMEMYIYKQIGYNILIWLNCELLAHTFFSLLSLEHIVLLLLCVIFVNVELSVKYGMH